LARLLTGIHDSAPDTGRTAGWVGVWRGRPGGRRDGRRVTARGRTRRAVRFGPGRVHRVVNCGRESARLATGIHDSAPGKVRTVVVAVVVAVATVVGKWGLETGKRGVRPEISGLGPPRPDSSPTICLRSPGPDSAHLRSPRPVSAHHDVTHVPTICLRSPRPDSARLRSPRPVSGHHGLTQPVSGRHGLSQVTRSGRYSRTPVVFTTRGGSGAGAAAGFVGAAGGAAGARGVGGGLAGG
jgi:hypothetical protein